MNSKTKVQKARELYETGEIVKALGISKDFRLGCTKKEKDSITRAYEIMVHGGDLYKQMGFNLEDAITEGVRVFELRFLTNTK